ncbi:hypothetical protein J6590_048371 [Homalodisca vitripennis]|nr:hypothetical protein J6590_048371 [Homalodisca vitripennis]
MKVLEGAAILAAMLVTKGSDEVRAKKHNLGTKGLEETSDSTPMAGQVARLQGKDGPAVIHPSSSHARLYLNLLSCDNHCTCYTA